MSQKILLHKKATDACTAVEVEPDTFVLSEDAEGHVEKMTYDEWEALRCRQSCAALKEKVAASDLAADKKAKVEGYLDAFTQSMQVKYLEGARSWTQIYTELVEDFTDLLK